MHFIPYINAMIADGHMSYICTNTKFKKMVTVAVSCIVIVHWTVNKKLFELYVTYLIYIAISIVIMKKMRDL